MPRNRKLAKPYSEMTARELATATRELDRPSTIERWKPLSASEREQFEQVRRAGGSELRHVLSIGLEPELFSEAVEYARKHKLTLPQVIARAVRGLIAFAS